MLLFEMQKKKQRVKKVVKTNKGRVMPFLKMCDSKNSILTKEQQTSGLLSNLGLEAPLNKRYKTNKVVNKYLLAGGAIKRGIITNQPFLYSAHAAELSDPTR